MRLFTRKCDKNKAGWSSRPLGHIHIRVASYLRKNATKEEKEVNQMNKMNVCVTRAAYLCMANMAT